MISKRKNPFAKISKSRKDLRGEQNGFVFSQSWLAALLKDLFFRLIKFLMKMNGISSFFLEDKDYYYIKSSEKIVENSLMMSLLLLPQSLV